MAPQAKSRRATTTADRRKGYLTAGQANHCMYIILSLKNPDKIGEIVDMAKFAALAELKPRSAHCRWLELKNELWDENGEELSPSIKLAAAKPNKAKKRGIDETCESEVEEAMVAAKKVEEEEADVAVAGAADGDDEIGLFMKLADRHAEYAAKMAALSAEYDADIAAMMKKLAQKKDPKKKKTKVNKSLAGSKSARNKSVGSLSVDDQMDTDADADTTEVTDNGNA